MANTKRIRQITENINGKERDPFVAYVGQIRRIPINGVIIERTIYEIVETETCYKIFIGNKETCQEWNDIAKSDRVNIQYFID